MEQRKIDHSVAKHFGSKANTLEQQDEQQFEQGGLRPPEPLLESPLTVTTTQSYTMQLQCQHFHHRLSKGIPKRKTNIFISI